MRRASPEIKAAALAAIFEDGAGVREVAHEIGFGESTVARWVAHERLRREEAGEPDQRPNAKAPAGGGERKPKAEPKAHQGDEEPATSQAVEALDANEGDTLAQIRALYREQVEGAALAKRDGNHTAAQRMLKAASDLMPTIARLEKAAAADDEVIRFSRQEVDRAMAGVVERVRKLGRRPILCSGCSRQLSIEYGTGARALPEHEAES